MRSLLTALLPLALAASVGCEEKTASKAPAESGDAPAKEEGRKAAPDKPADTPAATGDDPHGLRYGERVKAPELPAAKDPPAKLVGGWQLKPGARFDYDYTQLMAGRVGTKGGEQQVEGKGTLSVEGTGTDTANAVLRDVELKLTQRVGGKEDSRSHKPGEQTLKEAINTKEGAPPPEDPMVATMLRVPDKPLAVGESVSVPTRMPLESRGAPLWASGETKTTLKGFVQCGEHTCAHLEVELAISDVDKPAEVEGTFRARVQQKGVMLFDVDDGALHSWSGATHVSLSGEAPAPASQPASPVPGMQKVKTIDMAQDHYHELKRKPSA